MREAEGTIQDKQYSDIAVRTGLHRGNYNYPSIQNAPMRRKWERSLGFWLRSDEADYHSLIFQGGQSGSSSILLISSPGGELKAAGAADDKIATILALPVRFGLYLGAPYLNGRPATFRSQR